MCYLIREPDSLTSHGNNAKLHLNVLRSSKMKRLGFSDCLKDRWYRHWILYKDITLTISIMKTGKDWQIDVLDEQYCQPYDYQSMIIRSGNLPTKEYTIAEQVRDRVDSIMVWLRDAGILENWERGDYI